MVKIVEKDLRLIKFPDIFPPIWERYASLPIIFSLFSICPDVFGEMAIIQIPKALVNLLDNPISRFTFIFLITFTATSDIETALFTTTVFFAFLQLIRTPEEREEIGGFPWL